MRTARQTSPVPLRVPLTARWTFRVSGPPVVAVQGGATEVVAVAQRQLQQEPRRLPRERQLEVPEQAPRLEARAQRRPRQQAERRQRVAGEPRAQAAEHRLLAVAA